MHMYFIDLMILVFGLYEMPNKNMRSIPQPSTTSAKRPQPCCTLQMVLGMLLHRHCCYISMSQHNLYNSSHDRSYSAVHQNQSTSGFQTNTHSKTGSSDRLQWSTKILYVNPHKPHQQPVDSYSQGSKFSPTPVGSYHKRNRIPNHPPSKVFPPHWSMAVNNEFPRQR